MAGLYELHDRKKFEIIAIDNGGGDGSAMRRRLEAAFDKIITIAKMPDDEAVNQIRAAEIDIGESNCIWAPCMGILVVAADQINYRFPRPRASYSYILADKGDPRGMDITTMVVYLPHRYQANDRKRPIAAGCPAARTWVTRRRICVLQLQSELKITLSVFAR